MSARSGRNRRHGPGVVLTAGAIAALTALLPAASAAPESAPAASPEALPSAPDTPVKAAAPGAPAERSSGPARTRESTVDASAAELPVAVLPVAGLPDAGLPDVGLPDAPVATGASSPLAASGIPSTALDAYTRAAAGVPDCGIDWSLIAAIGRVESNHGRFAGATLHTDGLSTPPVIGIALTGVGTARILDTDGGRFDRDTVHDRAVGPMQFIPSTWARYANDGNGDGVADPFNIYDAAAATAEYLCAAGGDLSAEAGQARAVFAYNHSNAYVASVLTLAAAYAGAPPPDIPTPEAYPTPTLPPADPAGPPAIDPPVLAAGQPPTVVTAPTPEPNPTPTQASSPDPMPTPTPDPMPTPTPDPTPTPTPDPTPAPTPSPPTPDPTPTPTPEPEPTPPPEPEPTPPPEPEPTPAPAPSPTPTEPDPTPTPEPDPTPTPTPAPEPTPTPTPTEPDPTPTPEPTSCSGDDAPATVDLVNATGDQAVADDVAAHLAAAGLTVGSITSADSTASGLEYPVSEESGAQWLAEALGDTGLLRVGDVAHVTVVLSGTDSAALVQAVDALPACAAGE